MELYAKVKKGSKYEHQNRVHQKQNGYPFFKVEGVDFPDVTGGTGGNYPITSLQFYLRTSENGFVHIGNAGKALKVLTYA